MVNWVPLTADIFSVKSPCCRYDDLFIADEKGISTSFAALLQQTSRCTFQNGFFKNNSQKNCSALDRVLVRLQMSDYLKTTRGHNKNTNNSRKDGLAQRPPLHLCLQAHVCHLELWL